MSLFPISQPITTTEINTYVNFTVHNLTITPFVQATMIAQCFTAEGKIGFSQYLVMSGDDYQRWGGDDDYLINWVNAQLQQIPTA